MTRIDLTTQKDRNKYWALLQVAQADFENFLQQNYGIAPEFNIERQYTNSYNIVNEKKYLLTKIKYDI